MTPGVYNFVSTGPSGYAAVSFEAINETVKEIPVAFSPAAIIQEIGFANSLDVCSTCGTNSFASSDIVYDSAPAYQESFAPVEYASESIGCGGACGATCGSCGNFSGFSHGGGACGSCGGGEDFFVADACSVEEALAFVDWLCSEPSVVSSRSQLMMTNQHQTQTHCKTSQTNC